MTSRRDEQEDQRKRGRRQEGQAGMEENDVEKQHEDEEKRERRVWESARAFAKPQDEDTTPDHGLE